MIKTLWKLPLMRQMICIFGMSIAFVLAFEYFDVSGDLLEHIEKVIAFIQENRRLSFLILFVWSFILFLTIAPLGSFTVLAAGFLLGPFAGAVQFLALCLSSWVVHLWTHPGRQQAAYEQLIQRPEALRLVERFKSAPLLLVSVLRLIPVVPSCVCVLACSALGVAGKYLLQGTLLTGWVRPVFFAFMGSQASSLIELVN